MASKPGILTDWPWTPLGRYKYVVMAPWVIDSIYSYMVKDEKERDFTNLIIFPLLLLRAIHNLIWISFSRHRTAKGNNRILDKPIEFEQVDRERNWDDQIILNGIFFYISNKTIEGARHLDYWRTDGIIIMVILHVGPVEFLYYWFHRALHHHFLYSRYHSHHHSSIVTEPITSVIHPFAELLVYTLLFAIPMLTIAFMGTGSLIAFVGYLTYIDFMNNMGHCNFEIIPKSFFYLFPPLKYLMYTPSFHSLHHTQFRTNYSLFMPIYDYIYNTMDKSIDTTYESSLAKQEETPHVVYLTHLTTPNSLYHLRIGLASLASKPQTSKWYLWLMWPLTLCSILLTWVYAPIYIILERNRMDKLKLQTWAIPRYNFHYFLKWQHKQINSFIEDAILEADKKGVKVLSLGLLNQSNVLNKYGEVYVKRNPEMKIKLVDGSSLAVAVVVNSIPKGTTEILLRGNLNKVAFGITVALRQKGIKVVLLRTNEYEKLNGSKDKKSYDDNLVLSTSSSSMIWLVGDGFRDEEQKKAKKGTIFIPFSQFPLKKLRKDCVYYTTPAMLTPASLENIDSCENWLPRRTMSAWRVGGIVHVLEEWDEHECGYTVSNIDKVWEATLRHGFQPLLDPTYFD